MGANMVVYRYISPLRYFQIFFGYFHWLTVTQGQWHVKQPRRVHLLWFCGSRNQLYLCSWHLTVCIQFIPFLTCYFFSHHFSLRSNNPAPALPQGNCPTSLKVLTMVTFDVLLKSWLVVSRALLEITPTTQRSEGRDNLMLQLTSRLNGTQSLVFISTKISF